MLGDSHPQPLHAAACVHHNHNILGRSSGLYVPLAERKGQVNDGEVKARATTQPNVIISVWILAQVYPKFR